MAIFGNNGVASKTRRLSCDTSKNWCGHIPTISTVTRNLIKIAYVSESEKVFNWGHKNKTKFLHESYSIMMNKAVNSVHVQVR